MYKWHTGGVKPCYKCSRWDGQIFMRLDDVPDLPVHPNCICKIEVIGSIANKEFLDIGPKLEKARAQSKQDVSDLTFYAGLVNMLERLIDAAKSLLDDAYQVAAAADIFWENYQNMKAANTIGGDKYFHSKANAEAAQLGVTGEATAKFISDFREFYEYYTNVHLKKMSLQATIQDRMEDQKANYYGRAQGRQFPDGDPGDLVDKLRPRGLDEQY